MKGLFIFRRDLRLYDNNSLDRLTQVCDEILPIFILDPKQIDKKTNKYFSNNCVQFMMESLKDLNSQLVEKSDSQLNIFYGMPLEVLDRIYKQYKFDVLGMNMDYTPYSKIRDKKISDWCKAKKIEVVYEEDITALPIGSVRTDGGTIYKVFTPYFNRAVLVDVPDPKDLSNYNKFSDKQLGDEDIGDLGKYYKENRDISVRGGRKNGLEILKRLGKFKNYNIDRDIPSINSTLLSAYNKFGCISIREFRKAVLEKLGKGNKLLTQIYWRDFYYNIAYYYDYVFGGAFKKNLNKLPWENNKEMFKRWCEGKTGVPLVDAGMRQLNKTGFMHNRLRMVVSMYLTKDLLIDWRWGEKYFATKLVDYDPSQNNGGWQWSASTGTDSQPYFRIFNPFSMAKRVDPLAIYIKRWVPELKNESVNVILNWDSKYNNNYFKPMVNHSERVIITKELFKKYS